MFILKQRFVNDSSADNSEEDVSEGDVLQVYFTVSFALKSIRIVFIFPNVLFVVECINIRTSETCVNWHKALGKLVFFSYSDFSFREKNHFFRFSVT